MEVQVVLHLLRRPLRVPCAYPHPKRPRHHHRRHDVLVAAPRERVLVVAVVALAVVRLYVPMRTHYLREPLRALRVGVKRRDVVGNLFRRLAERLADVPPALDRKSVV